MLTVNENFVQFTSGDITLISPIEGGDENVINTTANDLIKALHNTCAVQVVNFCGLIEIAPFSWRGMK